MILRRVGNGKFGTLGVLWINGIPWCLTLEPENPIPKGTYPLSIYNSPANKTNVYLLHNVPGYTYIEIHPGNTYKDTAGCIVVGRTMDSWSGTFAILESKITFNKLMSLPIHDKITIS